ncbi:MAG TPA: YdeI/OmpD-associated family protein [Terracidiphilus sp.]
MPRVRARGGSVDVVIERDQSERSIEVPEEFAKAMKKAGVVESFEKLSYTHRKEYCRWITEATKAETRQTRLSKAVEMLKQGVRTPAARK